MANIKTRRGAVLTRNGAVTCRCCECGLSVNSSGGDEGWSQSFDVEKYTKNNSFDIRVTFTAFGVEDRFMIHGLYDSGCIGGGDDGSGPTSVTAKVTIPKGRKSIMLEVIPNCAGGSGTVWTLFIECIGATSEAPAP